MFGYLVNVFLSFWSCTPLKWVLFAVFYIVITYIAFYVFTWAFCPRFRVTVLAGEYVSTDFFGHFLRVFFLWFFVYVLAHQSNLGTYDGVLLELWQRCNLARMHLHQMTVWRILNKLSHWMSRVSESQNSTWYHVKEALKRFSKVLFGVLLNMISQSVEIFIWSTDSRVKTISFFPWLTLTVKE